MAINVLTSNQLTIVDITDQSRLSIYLSSNSVNVQTFSNGAYNPSWETTHLVITPRAFLDQDELNLSSVTITWKRKDGNGVETDLIAGETVNDNILTVTRNHLSNTTSGMLTYICYASYTNKETEQVLETTDQVTYTLLKAEISASSINFKIQPTEGDVFYNRVGTLPLAALAYDGVTDITDDATYQWYKYVSGSYVTIDGATDSIYMVNGEDVINIQTYKCVMTYSNQQYSATWTMEDKTDAFISEMHALGGNIFKNGQGGSAVYIVVRANGVEDDPFPENCSIGDTAPFNPSSGAYWWKIENQIATLMKYNGSSWSKTDDDPQKYSYNWFLLDKDGHTTDFTKTGKVIYLSCSDIDDTGTLQCEVHRK